MRREEGRGAGEGEQHTKGRKGCAVRGLASEILFLQPSESPARFSWMLTREGFSYGLSVSLMPIGGGCAPANSKCPGLAQPDALSKRGSFAPSAIRP